MTEAYDQIEISLSGPRSPDTRMLLAAVSLETAIRPDLA
jgi:hypothetical protein